MKIDALYKSQGFVNGPVEHVTRAVDIVINFIFKQIGNDGGREECHGGVNSGSEVVKQNSQKEKRHHEAVTKVSDVKKENVPERLADESINVNMHRNFSARDHKINGDGHQREIEAENRRIIFEKFFQSERFGFVPVFIEFFQFAVSNLFPLCFHLVFHVSKTFYEFLVGVFESVFRIDVQKTRVIDE
ncbi:MAG: hypothetical protein K0S12_979 [Bacteroidetes bacterium]|nr:hypothetical protein [Bacteroidota bacterium]